MSGAYAYTPAIWPPLVAAVLLAAIGHYVWSRRDVPGGKPFLAMSALSVLILLGIACEEAAFAPATKLAWQKFQFVLLFAGVIPVTCLALDYAYPGRWLTRRNLGLLFIPFLVCLLLVVINGSQLIWRPLQPGADEEATLQLAPAGAILVAYAIGMFVLNAAVFLHVFIRSPQHRWPVALMLLGQIGARATFLLDMAHFPALSSFNLSVFVVLVPWTAYAIALFGFRILDPLPFARPAIIEQIHAGVLVFDTSWRVASLNPAAESIVGISDRAARGKTWQQLASAAGPLPAIPEGSTDRYGPATNDPEMTFGTGASARHCAPALSELRDFRGLLMGHVLMLRDVTEEHRAQVQILDQQRSLAVMRERERLARELHDSIGQVLGYAGLQLEVILDHITDVLAALSAGQGAEASAQLVQAENHATRLSSIVQEAHADVREHILNLRLAPSDQRPFLATLRHYLDGYCQNYGIQTELSIGAGVDERVLEARSQTELFRILQEALANARKHANAGCVKITLETQDGHLRMRVQDNGRGFDPALIMNDESGHFGLRTMHERAEQLGAKLRVQSATGTGTCVVVDLPAQAEPREERP